MKKLFISLLLFLSLSIFSAFSLASGGLISFQENIFYGKSDQQNLGASFSIKPDNTNLFIEFFTGWNLSNNNFLLSGVLDYRLFEKEIKSNLIFYTNAGIKSAFDFSEQALLSLAPRAVFGLSFILFDGYLELFLQQAAEQNISFIFEDQLSLDFPLTLPFSIGFRIWD
ncbi:MAG: hypothetical protein K6E78_05650 [Treponema sp.]|nr:hypothetical protein [Treponema sp.]